MVRLERLKQNLVWWKQVLFTFQYGQIRKIGDASSFDPSAYIYIPVWLDQKAPKA